ncbi:hypothetical protein [Haloechinothrix salitolerans]|uniref:Uncharacterized protein n=1 Tax=Haloechinothrix salitolerans TaxID=926830 RepID=A0ABW2BZM4_9PSEU
MRLPRRRAAWRVLAGLVVLTVLGATAIVPDLTDARAHAQTDCVEDPNIGFCVVPQSYRIYFGDEDPLIDDYEWHAYSFTDLGTTTITLADGSTTTVNHYRFERLVVDEHILIQESRADYGVDITAPGPIELGGTNANGEYMWTDVWGTDLEFQWGTCAFTWTWVPDNIGLDISGCWLRMSAYAITSYNPDPVPGERDNPVYLPDATLRVTGGT